MPRLLAMLFLLLGLFCAAALPAHAEDDYNTTLDRLSRLQALAREFSSSRDDAPDPIVLTLSYTRTGEDVYKRQLDGQNAGEAADADGVGRGGSSHARCV